MKRPSAQDIRDAPLAPGEGFYLHRRCDVGEHVDGPACWCEPLEWTFAETRVLPLAEIARVLNQFYATH